jgi:hypothetical protein
MVLCSHKGAAAFKNRIFPLYEDLCIVYAKDHATGKDAQAPMDMCKEILHEKEDENNGLEEFHEDMSCMQLSTNGNGGEGRSGRKRKRSSKSTEDNIAHTIREVGNQLAANLITTSDNLSKAVMGSVERELRLKVNDELSKIIDLSNKDHLKAGRLIIISLR